MHDDDHSVLGQRDARKGTQTTTGPSATYRVRTVSPEITQSVIGAALVAIAVALILTFMLGMEMREAQGVEASAILQLRESLADSTDYEYARHVRVLTDHRDALLTLGRQVTQLRVLTGQLAGRVDTLEAGAGRWQDYSKYLGREVDRLEGRMGPPTGGGE